MFGFVLNYIIFALKYRGLNYNARFEIVASFYDGIEIG